MLKQRVCDIVVKAHIAGDMDLKFHGKTFNSYAPKVLAIQWLLTFSKGWKLMLSENLITLDTLCWLLVWRKRNFQKLVENCRPLCWHIQASTNRGI